MESKLICFCDGVRESERLRTENKFSLDVCNTDTERVRFEVGYDIAILKARKLIRKKCLDKTRVKEAIEKQIQRHDDGDCQYDGFIQILKELGLYTEE